MQVEWYDIQTTGNTYLYAQNCADIDARIAAVQQLQAEFEGGVEVSTFTLRSG